MRPAVHIYRLISLVCCYKPIVAHKRMNAPARLRHSEAVVKTCMTRWRNTRENHGKKHCFTASRADQERKITEQVFDAFLRSPYRIVDDCGGAFAMGAIGGGLFSFVKGWRNSPAVRPLLFFISQLWDMVHKQETSWSFNFFIVSRVYSFWQDLHVQSQLCNTFTAD